MKIISNLQWKQRGGLFTKNRQEEVIKLKYKSKK